MVTREAIKLSKKYKSPSIKMHYILKFSGREFKYIDFFHIPIENKKHADLITSKGVLLDCGVLVYNEERHRRIWIP